MSNQDQSTPAEKPAEEPPKYEQELQLVRQTFPALQNMGDDELRAAIIRRKEQQARDAAEKAVQKPPRRQQGEKRPVQPRDSGD